MIVGAPTHDHGELGEGRAYVYLGGAAGLATSPAWTAESDQLNAEFGNSVATAGDVNGDGFSDVIVGAWQFDNGETNEGRVFVYLGSRAGLSTSAAWTAEGDQQDAAFGMSVATAGDVNGDGYSDVVISAWQYSHGESNEGRVHVYLGSSAGLASSPVWTAESDQADARFGISVAPAGDIDGDGFDDVIVGADQFDNGEQDEGRAFLYRGSSTGLHASAAWMTESDQAIAHLGYSVSTAGDVNGDGYGDVIVGSIFSSHGELSEGRTLVYLGSSAGLSAGAAWTAESEQDFASFGSAVATAGDVNGDGYSDVLVAAQGFDNGELNEGRTFVYLGSASGLASAPVWTAEGDQLSARFGYSVATAGDVDADGYSDVIVGANLFENGQPSEGRAFVYMGSGAGLALEAASTHEGDQMSVGFGKSVASAGDVNGDGYSDVIVGAHRYRAGQASEGRAYVYLGSPTGISASADWTAESDQAEAEFGFCVAGAGDVNGDGYSDVIVGSYFYSNGESREGRAFVYLGSSAGLSTTAAWTAESNQIGALFGGSVASAGDVNGDGYGDVIVGASAYDSELFNEGRAFLYLGSAAGLSTTPAWTAKSDQSAAFGGCVASAGDINGDGYSDVVVGALGYSNGQDQEGRAFLYLGSSVGLSGTAAWTAESNDNFSEYGESVATAGDVNGDGYSDVIVGSSRHQNGPVRCGRAFVYLGASTGLGTSASWTAESGQHNSEFGESVATAGDVNGDGYSDVIVGAWRYDSHGQTDEGRACVYLGSSTGLSSRANWITESDQTNAYFGISVATAGDVNGDAYSDVIVGAYRYDNGQLDEGRTFLYLGNEGRGSWTTAPQQRQASDLAPIQALGRSRSHAEFRIQLAFAHSLAGFDWASGLAPNARLEWQVEPLSSPLDGSDVGTRGAELIGGARIPFNEIVSFADDDAPVFAGIGHHSPARSQPFHWHARIRTNNPLFPVTPWVTIPGSNVTEAKLRAGPVRAKH